MKTCVFVVLDVRLPSDLVCNQVDRQRYSLAKVAVTRGENKSRDEFRTVWLHVRVVSKQALFSNHRDATRNTHVDATFATDSAMNASLTHV